MKLVPLSSQNTVEFTSSLPFSQHSLLSLIYGEGLPFLSSFPAALQGHPDSSMAHPLIGFGCCALVGPPLYLR